MIFATFSLILLFAQQIAAFSEECAHIETFRGTRNVGHTIVCSKLYHGIWAMPLANPVTLNTRDPFKNACENECQNYNQCPLALTCLDGTDGLCVFNTGQLKSGLIGSNCPGNGFAINYICLPLKEHIKDYCFGNPGTFCYQDDFKSDSPFTNWLRINQKTGGKLTQKSTNAVYHDRLQFDATHVTATFTPGARPALGMLVSDANAPGWENYIARANFRIVHNDFTVFLATPQQMVGLIVRHQGNAVTGSHYMFGWMGAASGKKFSQIALYHWQRSGYKLLKAGRTAPLPANKWFGMSAEVVSGILTLRTNKSPLGENTTDCSTTGGDDPVNCNEYQTVFQYTLPTGYNAKGSVGLYFAGATGWVDDLSVVHMPRDGECGNEFCQPDQGENCINCPSDCLAPCGCGDGICAGDHEALGCREDCFQCKVFYVNNKTKEWFFREDNVAAYYSFDNPDDLGEDNSQNFMHLYHTLEGASVTTPCASGGQMFNNRPPRCIRTEIDAPLFLKKANSAFGKLPVGSCDVTIAAWVKVTGITSDELPSALIRWGASESNRVGLATTVRVSSKQGGMLTWFFGLHTHTVTGINWNKAGLRHVALVYSSKDVESTIYIDGLSKGTKPPCTQTKTPQMVTFGRLAIGDFDGYMDDLKILSVAWTQQQVLADFMGSQPYVKPPASIGFLGEEQAFPTPVPFVPTPRPATTLSTSSTTAPDETYGDLWPGNQPTPVKVTCRQKCEQYCSPRPFFKCLCAHEFAIPDYENHVVCDATRLQAVWFLFTSLFAMYFVL